MGLNPELVKRAFGWVASPQSDNTVQIADGFRNVGTVQMPPKPSVKPTTNMAAKATGQTVAGSGEAGTLSGQQPKSASLNPTLVKMAVGRVLCEIYQQQGG